MLKNLLKVQFRLIKFPKQCFISKKRQLRELIGNHYYKTLINDNPAYKFNNTLNNMEGGIDSLIEASEESSQQPALISKNQMAKDAKKMKKKVAQALAVIIKAEQK